MKKMLTITARELSAYFTTWLGYGVISAALLLNGILFNAFALGEAPKFSSDVLRDYFYFASGIGIAAALLLAMRLIAEERQSKSLVLLLSSPVSDRQIIWGKFLAAFFLFTLMNVLSLYLPSLIFIEGKVSFSQILVGYLGVSLLGSAVLAIALFASTLAPSQLLAGVAAVAITMVFLLLWMLAVRTDSPFREVLGYVSLHNDRFRPFTQGLVHSRDVIFYLSMTVFFTECAARALEERRLKG